MNKVLPGWDSLLDLEQQCVRRLLEKGIVTPGQVASAITARGGTASPLHFQLISGGADELSVAKTLAEVMGLDFVDLEIHPLDPVHGTVLPESISKKHLCLVTGKTGNVYQLAMADPLNPRAIEDAELLTGEKFCPAVTTSSGILRILERANPVRRSDKLLAELDRIGNCEFNPEDDSLGPFSTELGDNESPMARIANLALSKAIAEQSEEILIRATTESLTVKLLRQGIMEDFLILLPEACDDLFHRFKVMARWPIDQPETGGQTTLYFCLSDRTYTFTMTIMASDNGRELRLRPG